MMLVRWQPWNEFERINRQIDQVFDELVGSRRSYAWMPAVELHEAPEYLTLRAILPGMERKDLNVEVTREAVLISGERRHAEPGENATLLHSEFGYGQFRRVIALPVPVQNDRAIAEYNNGILTLTLPKVTEASDRVVKVNIGEVKPVEQTPGIAAESTEVVEDRDTNA